MVATAYALASLEMITHGLGASHTVMRSRRHDILGAAKGRSRAARPSFRAVGRSELLARRTDGAGCARTLAPHVRIVQPVEDAGAMHARAQLSSQGISISVEGLVQVLAPCCHAPLYTRGTCACTTAFVLCTCNVM